MSTHQPMSSNEPQNKKSRTTIPEVVYQGPVPLNFYSIPMDTIYEYQRLQALLSRTSENRPRPLSILYGPRQFGKTTIAHRLAEEIMQCGNIHVIFLHLSKSHVCTEKSFWNALCQLLDAKKRDISSEEEFVKAVTLLVMCWLQTDVPLVKPLFNLSSMQQCVVS
jgi:hypothetical protein